MHVMKPAGRAAKEWICEEFLCETMTVPPVWVTGFCCGQLPCGAI